MPAIRAECDRRGIDLVSGAHRRPDCPGRALDGPGSPPPLPTSIPDRVMSSWLRLRPHQGRRDPTRLCRSRASSHLSRAVASWPDPAAGRSGRGGAPGERVRRDGRARGCHRVAMHRKHWQIEPSQGAQKYRSSHLGDVMLSTRTASSSRLAVQRSQGRPDVWCSVRCAGVGD